MVEIDCAQNADEYVLGRIGVSDVESGDAVLQRGDGRGLPVPLSEAAILRACANPDVYSLGQLEEPIAKLTVYDDGDAVGHGSRGLRWGCLTLRVRRTPRSTGDFNNASQMNAPS